MSRSEKESISKMILFFLSKYDSIWTSMHYQKISDNSGQIWDLLRFFTILLHHIWIRAVLMNFLMQYPIAKHWT